MIYTELRIVWKSLQILKGRKTEVNNKRAAEIYKNGKNCYIWKEKLRYKYAKDKNMVKLGIIVFIQGNIEVLCITYVIRNIGL